MFFSFFVFIIWKTIFNREKKDYTLINIRKLSEFIILDAYYLFL